MVFIAAYNVLWVSCYKSRVWFITLLLGMANGLLPCGMVYLAIAGALSTTGVEQSVLFMAAFGSGTLPAMLLLSFFGVHIKLSLRRQNQKGSAVYYCRYGCVAHFTRYEPRHSICASPVLADAPQPVISCH